MQGDIKKNDISKEEPEIDSRFSETLAAYLEQRNSGSTPEAQVDATSEELRLALALIQLPEKAAQDRPDVDRAWQMFRNRAFVPAEKEVPEVVSLGGYVSSVLETGEATKESGLPRETLEALREDHTPLTKLKDFELADYAALAKHYGVKENLFPRMLKWLKGLGKNFAAPSFGGGGLSRGMMYARERDYEQQVSEEYMTEELQRTKEEEEKADHKKED